MITSEEIAKIAGVSRSTVSRVVNNYPNVPSETKAKIMEVIEKYGYVPNSSARVLAGMVNKTIGLFVADIHSKLNKNRIIQSPWLSTIVSAAADYAAEQKYNLLVSLISDKTGFRNAKDMLMNKTISGALFAGLEKNVPEIDELDHMGFKLAIIDQKKPEEIERQNSIFVNSDNIMGAYEATKYLINSGHKKIIHLTGDVNKTSGYERLVGFKKAINESNIKFDKKMVIKGDYLKETAFKQMKKAIESGQEFTGVFAANDVMALGVMDAVRSAGMKVPDDVSVIGYDDSPLATASTPQLTTIRTPLNEMVEILVRNLISGIESNSKISADYVIATELIERGTVKKL